MIFNLMGYPSTHVPIKLDINGLPVGLQVSNKVIVDLEIGRNGYLSELVECVRRLGLKRSEYIFFFKKINP